MIKVNIHQAKTQFSRLITSVCSGEEVVIAKSGKPVARLLPYEKLAKKRVPDLDKGLMKVPEDFDAPLPEDILRDFGA